MSWRDRDLAWLKDSGSWPRWPLCPVKRFVGGAKIVECAVIIDEDREDGKVRCVEVNLFALKPGPLAPQLEGKTEHVYDSYEAMLSDNWEVD